MNDKQPNYVIKWVLGILSALLITIVVGGSSLLLRVDKAQALQDVQLQSIASELSDISDKLEPVVEDNRDKVHDLDRDVLDIRRELGDVKSSIDDLDETVRLVGRNLEDQLKKGKP